MKPITALLQSVILSGLCLLIASTNLHAQKYVINGDTVYCYPSGEVRVIADRLVELDGCKEELAIAIQQVSVMNEQVVIYKSREAGFQAEVNIRDKQVELYKDQVRMYRNRSRLTITLSTIAIGIITFLAIK